MATVSEPGRHLYIVCSWCREPVAGQQLRLFTRPDETTHTICERCFERVATPSAPLVASGAGRGDLD